MHVQTVDPGSETELPAHNLQPVEPGRSWNIFAGQRLQSVEFERPVSALKVPTGHSCGVDVPAGQIRPGGQGKPKSKSSLLGVDEFVPPMQANPAGQSGHSLFPGKSL